MDLRLALDDGFSKGGIKGRRDFRIHLSFAVQKRNQVEKQGRLALVQLVTGMKWHRCHWRREKCRYQKICVGIWSL